MFQHWLSSQSMRTSTLRRSYRWLPALGVKCGAPNQFHHVEINYSCSHLSDLTIPDRQEHKAAAGSCSGWAWYGLMRLNNQYTRKALVALCTLFKWKMVWAAPRYLHSVLRHLDCHTCKCYSLNCPGMVPLLNTYPTGLEESCTEFSRTLKLFGNAKKPCECRMYLFQTYFSRKECVSSPMPHRLAVNLQITDIHAPLKLPSGYLIPPNEIKTPRLPKGTYWRKPWITEAPPGIVCFFQTGCGSVVRSESKPSTGSFPWGKSRTTLSLYWPCA